MKLSFTVKDILIYLKSLDARYSAQIEQQDITKNVKNSIVMQCYNDNQLEEIAT